MKVQVRIDKATINLQLKVSRFRDRQCSLLQGYSYVGI